VTFNTAPPASFPVAQPVAPPAPPPPPPEEAPPPPSPVIDISDEIDVDLDVMGVEMGDMGDVSDADDDSAPAGGGLADFPVDFGGFGAAPVVGERAPSARFPTPERAPSGRFTTSPPPIPADGPLGPAFGTAPAFGPAPSRSFGLAIDMSDMSDMSDMPDVSQPEAPAPQDAAPPPPAPQAPQPPPAPVPATFTPAAPISNPWGPSSSFGAAPSAPSLSALPDSPTPSPSALPPMPTSDSGGGVSPSWGSNPTVVVRSDASGQAGGAGSLPAGLTGLFDSLDPAPSAAADAPTSMAPALPDPEPDAPASGADAASTVDDNMFNFSLEPGSTVEPNEDISPFHGDNAPAASVHDRPIRGEFQEDVPSVPPPGAGMDTKGGFAELDVGDVDMELDALADDDGLPLVPSQPLDDDLPAPPMMDFSAPPAPPQAPPPPTPTHDDLPAPPVLSFGATGDGGDEASFAGLSMDFDDANSAAGGDGGDAAGGDFGVDLGAGDADAAADDAAEDAALASFDALDAMGAESPEAPTAAPTSPTLSSRVGVLAENLEEAGRFADAALLYEAQAALVSQGR